MTCLCSPLQPNLAGQIAALRETVIMLSLRRDVVKRVYEDLQSLGPHYQALVTALRQFSANLDQAVPEVSRSPPPSF